MVRVVYFRELDFMTEAVFLAGILAGWALLLAGESLREHTRTRPRSAAENY